MRLRGITKRVEGQILVIVISISAIAALLLSGVSILLSSSFNEVITTANVSLDQSQATSAFNYLTTALNDQAKKSSLNFSSLPGGFSAKFSISEPSLGQNATEQTYVSNRWMTFNSLGDSQTCAVTSQGYINGPCYYMELKVYSSSNAAGGFTNTPAQVQSITAEVAEGRDCVASTASNAILGEGCKSLEYYSDNISANNYYNYLYFTNYETLAPRFYPALTGSPDPNVSSGADSCQNDNTSSSCIPVAYESDYISANGQSSYGDTLNGAIRTNSKEVFTCIGANGSFNVPVIEATSSTPIQSNCNPVSATAPKTVNPINFPSSVSSLAQIAYPYWFPKGVSVELLPTGNMYLSFDPTSDPTYNNFWQNTLLPLLSANGDSITNPNSSSVTVTMPIPSNGVVYSTGAISNLVGVLSGQLTVAANGDIAIANSPASQPSNVNVGSNLYYNCAYSSSSKTTVPSGCTDLLGVVAQGDISIGALQSSFVTPSITVDGALTALGSASKVPTWSIVQSVNYSSTVFHLGTYDPQNGLLYYQTGSSVIGSSVTAVNPTNGKIVAQIALPNPAGGITYDPANGLIYIAVDPGGVAVINPNNNTLLETIPTPNSSYPFFITYANGNIYEAGTSLAYNGGSMTVINPSNQVIATFSLSSSYPQGMAYDPINQEIYVANDNSKYMTVVNASTDQVAGTIPSAYTYDAVYSSANGYIYATQAQNNSVAVIDPSTNTVIKTIQVGTYPTIISYLNGYVYVGNQSSSTVSVIDPSTNTVVSTVSVPNVSVTADSTNGYIYTSYGSNISWLTVSAALPGGTIYATNWQGNSGTTANTTCLSQLASQSNSSLGVTSNNFININGSLVAQYRGVFGEYNQSAAGNNSTPCLLTGYYKNFTWDSRLAHNQPPYSYSPTSSAFVSLGTRHTFGFS